MEKVIVVTVEEGGVIRVPPCFEEGSRVLITVLDEPGTNQEGLKRSEDRGPASAT